MAGSGILFQVGQHSSQNCLRENISNVDWNSMDFPGSCGCMTHFLRFTDFYLSLVPLCAQITLGKLYRILFLSRGETFVFICDQLCSLLQAQDVQKAYLVIVQQRISEWLKAKHPDQSLHRKEAKKKSTTEKHCVRKPSEEHFQIIISFEK